MASQEFREAVRLVQSQLDLPTAKLARPLLIIFSGLPGTGKSTLAEQVGATLPAVVIQSDFVRKLLFHKPQYTWQENRLIHAVARALIREYLRRGYAVISDATNLHEWHRELLRRAAASARAPVIVVETVAPESVIRARLRKRFIRRQHGDISDANWQIYELLHASSEPIKGRHLRVDTSQELDSLIGRIVRAARHAVTRKSKP